METVCGMVARFEFHAARVGRPSAPAPVLGGARHIVETVARFYGLTAADLRGRRRFRHVAQPRQVAAYLVRRLTGMSLVAVGIEIGGRDHTTVMYAVREVGERMRTNDELRR